MTLIMEAAISQRLLRKGALVDETYQLFSGWDESKGLAENLDSGLQGQFRSAAWGREVRVTLRRRFRDTTSALPLIRMAQGSLPIDEWRSCFLLWLGIREPLFGEFVMDWLYPEYEKGRHLLKTQDITGYLTKYWQKTGSPPLSEYGTIRTARDLLRMASDFGLLEGSGPQKTFASFHLSDRCFLYFAHAISDQEGAASLVPESRYWRLPLMSFKDVETAMFRLHQFQKLEYQVAGTLVQLALPCSSALEYAGKMKNE